MIQNKEIGLRIQDFLTWTLDDLYQTGKVLCELLSIRNCLYDYVKGVLRNIWNNYKK